MKHKLLLSAIIAMIFIGIIVFFSANRNETGKDSEFKQSSQNLEDEAARESKELAVKKAECAERLNKMDDNQLADEIIRLKEVGKSYFPAPEVGDDGYWYARRLLAKYAFCALDADRNEKKLELARKVIGALSKDQSSISVSDRMNWAEGLFSGAYNGSIAGFYANVAMGDLKKICPGELEKACLAAAKRPDKEKWCAGLCGRLAEAAEKGEDSVSDEFSGISFRTAVAYRLGGKENAQKICAGEPEEKRDDCERKISDLEIQKISCDGVREKIADFACVAKPSNDRDKEQEDDCE